MRALFFRARADSDLDDELAFHIEMQTRKNVRAGMPLDDARREAALQFGSGVSAKEACRDERRVSLIETLFRDIRYAVRGFRRAPLFALTVIATISLGLGVNTAVFTIFNAYVLRPLSVQDPWSLYQLNWLNRARRGHAFSWRQDQDLRARNGAFSDFYAARSLQSRVNGRTAFVELVSGNYFDMLGVGSALGRTLTSEDASVPGRGAVAVLSYRGWRTIFGGDPAIVGKNVLLRGAPLEIVGVAREGFEGLNEVPQDLWAPLTLAGQVEASNGPDLFGESAPERLSIFGRLKPRVSESQALADLNIWVKQLGANRPQADKPVGAVLYSRATNVRISPEAFMVLLPILAAFALILLTACANVANMMLARAMARQREIGIRLSLGAARGRLIRQLLTESVLLALPGALLGFFISRSVLDAGVRIMYATLPQEFADFIRVAPLTPDFRVFAFMIAAAAASGLIFGLVPALQATRASVVQASRGDFGNELRPQRMRNALVIVQITVCAMLLICSGVLLRGANRIHNRDIGFRTHDVIWIEVTEKYRAPLLTRLAEQSLVQTVAASAAVLLDSGLPSAHLSSGEGKLADASYNYVSRELFTALDLPILRGRNFTVEEARGNAPVAIISEMLARRLWPEGGDVGGSITFKADPRSRLSESRPLKQSVARVIGVARDINTGLVEDENSRLLVYFPTDPRAAGNALVLRVRGNPAAARQALDRDLSAAVPGAIDSIHLMDQFVAGRVYPFRLAYWISAVLGGLALLLTISGTYGVISYLVAQRIREFGVRMALGAAPFSVIKLVLRQSLRLAITGTLCGSALALACSRLLASRIVMLDAFDRFAFSAGILIVIASCLAAAFIPSWRASRIDPMTTLRHD
jgi:predicted permease